MTLSFSAVSSETDERFITGKNSLTTHSVKSILNDVSIFLDEKIENTDKDDTKGLDEITEIVELIKGIYKDNRMFKFK